MKRGSAENISIGQETVFGMGFNPAGQVFVWKGSARFQLFTDPDNRIAIAAKPV